MTYQNLVDAAVRMVCEGVDVYSDVSDYEERSQYLLASAVGQIADIDVAYRRAHGLPEQVWTPVACVTLSGVFPLCDVFVPAVEYFLASMLVMDENEEMSDRFFDLWSSAISSIRLSITASHAPIVNRYPGTLI